MSISSSAIPSGARWSTRSRARAVTSCCRKWSDLKVSKILIEKNGGEWIADEYLELGHSEWGSMVNKIKGSGCDVVLSNVVRSEGVKNPDREERRRVDRR